MEDPIERVPLLRSEGDHITTMPSHIARLKRILWGKNVRLKLKG